LVFFPQQDVVFEEDGVALRQVEVGNRHHLTFDLACAVAKVKLGHVPQARSLSPAGIADQILNVERRATGLTGPG
jgi:hypothetical protein